ncbi:MAG: SRPBCC domain-containing protein [Opitutaceae bacterium]|nr:SRPBCC domain-containing protein [Opitutaceae bacterium]
MSDDPMVPPPPTSVRIERSFSASPDAVWRAWTDAKMVSRWFGSDPAGRVLAARMEVRSQGPFEVTFADSDGSEHTCSGTYLEVSPVSKLSFSWHWQSEPGIETFVQVSLDPLGAGTRMWFEHAGLNATSTHDYAAGWQRTFEKLARVLEATL